MIVTLCGEAEFEKHFVAWNFALTMLDWEVFSLPVLPSQARDVVLSDAESRAIEESHRRKIDASHAVLFLNPGNRPIGRLVLEQWTYACRLRPVFILEKPDPAYYGTALSVWDLVGRESATVRRWLIAFGVEP